MADETSTPVENPQWFSLLVGIGLLALLNLTACGSPDASAPPPQVDSTDTRTQELMDLVEETDSLSALENALKETDLAKMLRDVGPYTLLAPTNKAFRTIPTFDTLLVRDPEDSLRTLLSYHVIRGRIRATDIKDSLRVSTLHMEPLTFQFPSTTQQLFVNDLPVLESHEAQNGTLYVISSVLHPSPPDTTQAQEP